MTDDIEAEIEARLSDWRRSDKQVDAPSSEASIADDNGFGVCDVGHFTSRKETRSRSHQQSLATQGRDRCVSRKSHQERKRLRTRTASRGSSSAPDQARMKPTREGKAHGETFIKELVDDVPGRSTMDIWETRSTVTTKGERYAKPRERKRAERLRPASLPSTRLEYESVATLVAEARKEIHTLVKEAKTGRKRVDWFAYRGPMIPRKILLGLRAKQKERECRAKDLARAAGLVQKATKRRRR